MENLIKPRGALGLQAFIHSSMPASLLITGTPREIEDFVKYCSDNYVDSEGKKLSKNLEIPERAKLENIQAMTNAIFKYGVYKS